MTPTPGEEWSGVKSGNRYEVLHIGEMRHPDRKQRQWIPSVVLRLAGTTEVYTVSLEYLREKYQRTEEAPR